MPRPDVTRAAASRADADGRPVPIGLVVGLLGLVALAGCAVPDGGSAAIEAEAAAPVELTRTPARPRDLALEYAMLVAPDPADEVGLAEVPPTGPAWYALTPDGRLRITTGAEVWAGRVPRTVERLDEAGMDRVWAAVAELRDAVRGAETDEADVAVAPLPTRESLLPSGGPDDVRIGPFRLEEPPGPLAVHLVWWNAEGEAMAIRLDERRADHADLLETAGRLRALPDDVRPPLR